MTERILLINPAGTRRAYLDTNVRVGAPILPVLGLASIAGAVRDAGHEVRVLDLDLADVSGENVDAALSAALENFNPGIAGLTSVTPTWPEMMRLAENVRKQNPDTKIICGGVHSSMFPDETLAGGIVDVVAIGEADFTLNEILQNDGPENVPGVAYVNNGETVFTDARGRFSDMDSLPYPAWDLFDKNRYHMSRLTERMRPGGYIETSRGCPADCVYCNKSTFGRAFRAKSPERVVDEIEVMLRKHKFRELHIIDDGFTTNLERAKKICELIIERGLQHPFNLFNGVRADRIDDEMCALLKRAGCYQVAFGIESGNAGVLDSVSKGLSPDTVRRAVKLCKKHGLETFGFFMIALPEDTRETVLETIDFAVELDMTIAKFDIATPLPGTRMFEMYDRMGLIRTRDWGSYVFHQTSTPIFDHPNMSWEEIEALYKLAFRRVYLRPGYIAKRFVHGLRTGGLWYDVVYFLGSRWS